MLFYILLFEIELESSKSVSSVLQELQLEGMSSDRKIEKLGYGPLGRGDLNVT